MSILEYLFFPGLIFTLLAAFLVSWIDRKVTALAQFRIGPPILQPVYDFLKLMKKETIIPRGGNIAVFLLSPVVSFASVVLISMLLVKTNINMEGFVGDVFVLIYLLLVPAIAVIMGGAASANPLASLGASREMKMVLSYELPFILALCTVFIKTGGLIGVAEIIRHQMNNGMIIGSLSGILAFLVTFICFQSKMALIPFDLSEAEQEIKGGALIEYTGAPLAFFIASRWILMAVLPFLIVILFLGGINSMRALLKYIAVLVSVILVKNINPRLRIDQTLKFFWGPVTLAAFLSVVFALLGL